MVRMGRFYRHSTDGIGRLPMAFNGVIQPTHGIVSESRPLIRKWNLRQRVQVAVLPDRAGWHECHGSRLDGAHPRNHWQQCGRWLRKQSAASYTALNAAK